VILHSRASIRWIMKTYDCAVAGARGTFTRATAWLRQDTDPRTGFAWEETD
jgi:hypothetical protein